MKHAKEQIGWAVELTRKDGSTFMASASDGNLTPVWIKSRKHSAKLHQQLLAGHGLDARVVRVRYVEPQVLVKTK